MGTGPAPKTEGQAKGSEFQVLLPGEVLAMKVPGCFSTIQISQVTNGPLPDYISAAPSAGGLSLCVQCWTAQQAQSCLAFLGSPLSSVPTRPEPGTSETAGCAGRDLGLGMQWVVQTEYSIPKSSGLAPLKQGVTQGNWRRPWLRLVKSRAQLLQRGGGGFKGSSTGRVRGF